MRHVVTAEEPSGIAPRIRDLVALTKPRITLMVVLTAAGGMWLAPVSPSLVSMVVALVSLALVVSSANAFNCYLERDIDKLMRRTAKRPLPAARLSPRPALAFAIGLGMVSIPALFVFVNPLTAILGVASLAIYVLVYTPMKQRSPAALLVGAVPGAMPPLMGWTAATGTLDWAGLVLFGILFLWQLPHFIAISVFRESEYTRAGLKVLPAVRGRRVAYVHAVLWAALLVPVSLVLGPLGVASTVYTVVAAIAGLYFFAMTVLELRPSRGERGARRVFVASLVYLPILMATLMASGG
jgi:protoheme IX farnesyltransferase